MMADIRQVAAYFLNKANSDDAGDLISNLKLQKLVYYALGFYLAIYGRRLFRDELYAWQHGPVFPSLYHKYKQFGNAAIPTPDDFDTNCLSDEVKDLLDEVYYVYGQFSAWKLRNMTHEEPPWKDVRAINDRITDQALIDYFKTQLN